MKKIFAYSIIALLCLCAACTSHEGGDMIGEVVFELDNDRIAVSPDGGDFYVKLRTNQSWTLKCPEGSEWCVPSITKGEPNMEGVSILFCTDLAYDSRQATFWFEFGNGEYRSLTVSQKAKAVIFPGEDNHFEIPAEGAIAMIEFESTYPCKVVIPDNVKWVEQVVSRSVDSYTISLNIAENTTYSSRETVVKLVIIENEEVYESYTITQAQRDAILPGDDNTFEVGSEGAPITINFQANVAWEVVIPEDVDWVVKATKTRALKDESVELQVLENEDYSARSAKIQVVGVEDRSLLVEYTINQAQKDAVVADENNVVEIPAKGGLVEIPYETNVRCEISVPEDVEWIHPVTIEPSRALQSMYMLLNIDENTTYSEREAEVKVVMSGNEEVYAVYTIKQLQNDAILPGENNTYEVGAAGDIIRIDFQTNVDWNVVISDEGAEWIRKTPKRASLTSAYVDLEVVENTTFDPRSAKIQIVSAVDDTLFVEYTVNQAQRDAIVADENNTFEVLAEGGDISINYETNVACEVIIPEDVTWITKVEAEATRALVAGSVTLRVAANTTYGEREAQVKVVMSGNDELCAVYTVKQLQNDAVLEDGTIHFEISSVGGELELKYMTNVECELVIDEEAAEWISKREATRSLSAESAFIVVAPNTTHSARSAVVKVVMVDNHEVAVSYTINQTQMHDIVLDDNRIEAGVEGGVVSLGYQTNVECKVTIPEDCEWIYLAPETRGLEERELLLVIEANPNFEPREAVIKISGANINRDITVAQEAKRLEIEQRDYAVSFEATTVEVAVDANVVYEVAVAEGCDWITVADVEGNPSKELLILSLTENETIYERSAEVVVKHDACEVVLNVTQSGAEGILNVDEEYVVEGEQTELVVELESNFSYSVNIPEDCDWVRLPMTRRAKLESSSVRFSIDYNPSVLSRSVDILFADSKQNFTKNIRITQLGNDLLELFDVQDNEILYMTTDGSALEHYKSSFGSQKLDNVYENGYGRITFNGAVSQLGDGVFENCTNLKQIAIPGCVESIGNKAFKGCTALEDITIPQSVKHIGDEAFRGTSIAMVAFEDASQLESIGRAAFRNCKGLESVVVPDGVKSLGNSAFSDCINLGHIQLPQALESIGNNFLGNCYSLQSVVIPDGVKVIATSAFLNCTNLQNVALGAGVEEIGASAFSGCRALASVNFPDVVTTIGNSAFYGCSSMTEIVFGEESQLKSIGDKAFAGCTSVSRVVLPAGVESIGANAFEGCRGELLLNANVADASALAGPFTGSTFSRVEIGDMVTVLGNNAFCNANTIEEIKFGAGVGTIGDGAFSGCSSVVAIDLPEGVNSIGNEAFKDCTNVGRVSIPAGVETFGTSAFVGCAGELILNSDIWDGASEAEGVFYGSKFNTITLGDNVKHIGNYAFAGCDTIEKIYWGGSIERLGDSAFSGCSSIENVTLPASTQKIGSSVFADCTQLTTVALTNNITAIEESAFAGCTSLYTFVPSHNLESIGNEAFKGCTSLTNFEFPETLRTLGEGAFEECRALANVVLPSSVEEVGKGAFADCSNIESVELSNAMSTVAESMFEGCTLLANIAIPDGVITIADYAFAGCSMLSAVGFGPESKLMTIGVDAFSYCSALMDIAIPATVTEVGDGAFMGCSMLPEIRFGEAPQLTTIGNNAFNGCTAVRRVELPITLHTIGESAFVGCGGELMLNTDVADGSSADSGVFCGTTFENVMIGDNVTSVGDYAFAGCNTITNVALGANIENLGDGVFEGCVALSQVNMPANIVLIGDRAFGDCSSITDVALGDALQLNSIGDEAFAGCTAVQNVSLPESLSDIGDSVFVGCGGTLLLNANIADGISEESGIFCGSKFNNVVIGEKVTSIGDYAFAGCDTIGNVAVGSNLYSLGVGAFKGCSALSDVIFAEASQLSAVKREVFNGCVSLKSIIIPDSVAEIKDSAFKGCVEMESVKFGATSQLTTIEGEAFRECAKVKYIEIPNTVARLGASAFMDCSSLVTAIMGSGVELIDNRVFYGCGKLNTVYSNALVPPALGSEVFGGCSSSLTIYVPKESVKEYQKSKGWNALGGLIVGAE